MLAGVGPFAIEAGMIPASAPETTVRIHNVNTGKLIEAVVQTPGGSGDLRGQHRHRRRAGYRRPDPPGFPRRGRRQDRPPVADRAYLRSDPGRRCHLHRHGDADDDHARCRSSARPATSTRPSSTPTPPSSRGWRPSAARPAPRWGWATSPDGHPQAGPRFCARAGGTLHVRYFTPAFLPSRGRRHRCGRHRHGLRACPAASLGRSPDRRRRGRRR